MVRVHGHPHAHRVQHSRRPAVVPRAGAYGADRAIRQRMVALPGRAGTGCPVFHCLAQKRHGCRRREAHHGHRAVSRAGGHPGILRPYATMYGHFAYSFMDTEQDAQEHDTLRAGADLWRGRCDIS